MSDLHFSSTPPWLNTHCVCVCSFRRTEDPSHLWTCGHVTSPPPPPPSLLISMHPTNQRPQRSVTDHVTIPLVFVTMTTSTGPGSILLWWEEGRGGDGKRRDRNRRGKGGRNIQREQIPARGIHIWILSFCLSAWSPVSITVCFIIFIICERMKVRLSAVFANAIWQIIVSVICVCNTFCCVGNLYSLPHLTPITLCVHASVSLHWSSMKGWWQTSVAEQRRGGNQGAQGN